MKEVMAIIRQNMVNQTKDALVAQGFPAFTCLKILGRGKTGVNFSLLAEFMDTDEMPIGPEGEALTETVRLIPKRFFTLIVEDEDVDAVVKIIVDTNCTGTSGDGKIFILPIDEAIRVRTGETHADAY